MKRIFFIIIVVVFAKCVTAQTYGGEIQAKNNSNVKSVIARNGDALKVSDSAVAAKLAAGITAAMTGTQKPSYGSTTSVTVTNLNSLANSATAGWQSVKVSNLSTRATDYEINVKLTMANTAPANDKAAYIFVCPFYTSDAGTTWYSSSQGTATLPTGSEGTTTIASPHNLKLLGVLNYTTQNMVLQDTWFLSNAIGPRMPDGFSIIIINFTGAAINSSGNIVQYTPINDVLL